VISEGVAGPRGKIMVDSEVERVDTDVYFVASSLKLKGHIFNGNQKVFEAALLLRVLST
jgi:hypothetical protein